MNINIATSWKNESEVKKLAALLRSSGFDVDDFTDDSRGRFVFHYSELGPIDQHDAISFLKYAKAQRAFQEDKKMIDWADAVILLLPAGKSSHLEAGYAKGSGKKLIIYQTEFPKGEFDVMYGFADLITTNLAEIMQYLWTSNRQEVMK